MKMPLSSFPTIFHFLNDVINIVYHVENQQLTRYSGDYYQFLEVYEMKKSQLEAAYERQQKEIADLKDFVARNKARVATRNMAMSRQKKLDKMELIELQSEKPKPSFDFKMPVLRTLYLQAKDLQIGYDRPLTKPLNLTFERNQKVAIIRLTEWKNHPLEELAWNHPTDCWRSRGGEITLELATLSKRSKGQSPDTA